MNKICSCLILLILSIFSYAQTTDSLLTGMAMGSTPSYDYSAKAPSTTVNIPENVFDGNLNTFYASNERSYTWVGLDLGSKHIITRIGWCPRNTSNGIERMMLGVFEGANNPDFMDAVPLLLITQRDTIVQMNYSDISCSLGVRYVRYIGPYNARCNVAELEFYGHKGEGDLSNLYQPTNLPCVIIHTKDNEEPYDKEHYVRSIVSIISESNEKGMAPETVLLQDSAGVRLRGNASIVFPKKPYRIKFDRKHRVLGALSNAKNWVLVNNYGDKTLMRNILAFRISEVFDMPYTPFCQPVDVIVNGEYKGCYQLCDKVEVKKNRVEIEEMDSTDIVGEVLTGGYLWEIDGNAYKEPNPYYTPHNMPITLHSPKDEEITPEQRAYFENYFNTLDSLVYVASENDTTWHEYVDFSTFARYFLINQICANPDAYWQYFMYKKRNDLKAYSGPVWDFDLGFDNDKRQYPINNRTQFIYGAAAQTSPFIKHILYADHKTQEDLIEYWHIARNHGIDVDDLCSFIDSIAEMLYASQELNFTRWEILSKCVHQNPVALGSYDAEVERLKEFICARIEWVDNQIGYTWRPYTPPTPTSIENNEYEALDYYRVYDIFGHLIYEGEDIPQLSNGIFIIKHNGQSEKKIYY